jgi:hypothetical protein
LLDGFGLVSRGLVFGSNLERHGLVLRGFGLWHGSLI